MARFKQKLSSNGFTIIETLLVLIMMGIISVIIFKVVPSAQRTSRNAKRDSDVSAVISALELYYNDHDGSFPDPPLGSCIKTCKTYFLKDTEFNYYKDASVVEYYNTSSNVTPPPDFDSELIKIFVGFKCDLTSSSLTQTDANNIGAFVALYYYETSSSPGETCQNSN